MILKIALRAEKGLFHIWLAKFQANNSVTIAEAGFPVIAGFF
jgi:hypothetical protein